MPARTVKLLAPSAHLTIPECPGFRLKATASGRTWIYRYKSPLDGRMCQTKIGQWPATSPASAMAQWEKLREVRDAGRDPAKEKRASRDEEKAAIEQERESKRNASFTVRKLCDLYLAGHVDRHRKPKGATEIRRMFNTMLDALAESPAAEVTRSQAFDLLESYSHIPVQAATLRAELGTAWDYALDSGRLPESTPNWWRQIMRERLRSKGKRIKGEPLGTTKRVLTEAELVELIRGLPNFSLLLIYHGSVFL